MRLFRKGAVLDQRKSFQLTHSDIQLAGDTLERKLGNSGTGTVANGTTSIAITHELSSTPTRVQITPTTTLGSASEIYVSAKAATTFTVTVDTDPGADVTFDWRASVGEW